MLFASLSAQVAAQPVKPSVAILLVGDDAGSRKYAQLKVDRSRKAGMDAELIVLPASASQRDVLERIAELTFRPIHGIFVEFPLPPHLDAVAVARAIPPGMDVEGVNPENIGLLAMGRPGFVPTTAAACLRLLKEYDIKIAGKHAVIVGRSNTVGRPLALLLLAENATVTVCHSHTPDLAAHTQHADIVIAAVGKAGLITGDMVKPGAVVLDVGMNYTAAGLRGDVDYASVEPKAAWITPVPGGVGPVTTALILQNVANAAKGSPAPAAPR